MVNGVATRGRGRCMGEHWMQSLRFNVQSQEMSLQPSCASSRKLSSRAVERRNEMCWSKSVRGVT